MSFLFYLLDVMNFFFFVITQINLQRYPHYFTLFHDNHQCICSTSTPWPSFYLFYDCFSYSIIFFNRMKRKKCWRLFSLMFLVYTERVKQTTSETNDKEQKKWIISSSRWRDIVYKYSKTFNINKKYIHYFFSVPFFWLGAFPPFSRFFPSYHHSYDNTYRLVNQKLMMI